MPDITTILPSTNAAAGDIGGTAGLNGASTAQTPETETKLQADELSFVASFQQSLANLSEQTEQTELLPDGNNLPLNDEAAVAFHLSDNLPALAENGLPAAVKAADPLQQSPRRPAIGAVVMQQTSSTQAGVAGNGVIARDAASTGLAETTEAESDSLFTSRMLQIAADQPAENAADRRALDLLLAGGKSPAAELSNAPRTPPLNSSPLDTTASAPAQTTLTETFGRPDWGQGLGRQMLWMVNQNMRSAEMRLNPANLGPVEVRIEMDDEQQVSVAFNSRHAAVRDALELAIPRLREMFESNGMNLSNTDISDQSFAEQHNSAFGDGGMQRHGFAANRLTADDLHSVIPETPRYAVNDAMIDCYI